MAKENAWWACDCCGKKKPRPYSGDDGPPYSGDGYYSGRELGGCDCCGGDVCVITFNGTVGIPRPPHNRQVFTCGACATASFDWNALVGKSMTLTQCGVPICGNGGETLQRVYHGCGTYPIRCFSNEILADLVTTCPDLDGTVTFDVVVTCRKFGNDGGERCVSAHGGVVRVNSGPGNCGNPNGCGAFNPAIGCTPDPFSGADEYENLIGTLTAGQTYLGAHAPNCSGTVVVSATPGVNQYGITSATVSF